ncbi:MAG: NADH-quinone oxidoreductase subunit H [Crenarchaeota archaeon]|nr:NADH-quinone oxidoreductase subunit H [Thermoproteota archaeon]
MVWEIVGLSILCVLVFPGFVFLSALSFFSEWFLRKIVARMQNRMGPSYVGPFGILQPLADFLKLYMVKEEKIQRYSAPLQAKLGLSIAVGALVASTLLLPLSIVRFAAPYDVIILAYLCAVWVTVGIIVAAMAYPNPLTIAGASRLVALAAVSEPSWVAAVLIPTTLATAYGAQPPYSILATSITSWRLWFSPASGIAMALGLWSILIATQAKTMLKPFDIPEAEQELIAGHVTEFSGRVLALYELVHDMEIAFGALLITYLFLGGPYPFGHLTAPGIVVLVVKFIGVLFVLSLVRACMGRLRIEQGIRAVMKYSLVPALVGLGIAIGVLLA